MGHEARNLAPCGGKGDGAEKVARLSRPPEGLTEGVAINWELKVEN